MPKFQFCQKVRIRNLPQEIVDYYNDLQSDYRAIMEKLIRWSGRGYLIWDEDGKNFTVVEPENSSKERDSICAELGQFIELLSGGGTKSTNLYGVIYDNYRPRDTIRRDSKIGQFLQEGKFEEETEKFTAFSQEEWQHHRNRVANGEDFDKVWDEISPRVGASGHILCSRKIREQRILPRVKRSGDYSYCTALFSMVVSSFTSWMEISKLHEQKLKETEDKLEGSKKNCAYYESLLKFSESLSGLNLGLTKKVLRACIDDKPGNFFALACVEFKKYFPNAVDEKEIYRAYAALKVYWRLCSMQKYISFPNLSNDYQVPFGLTGRGLSFKIRSNNGQLWVQFDEMPGFFCDYSYYFDNLNVTQGKDSFHLYFRHKLKSKKHSRFGNLIQAELKEVKIQKRESNFYLYLPFSVSHAEQNFYAERYFRTAEPENAVVANKVPLLNLLDDQLTFCAFDLNLSTPLTMSKCVLKKYSNEGKVKSLEYGDGDFIGEPSIIAADTPLSRRIRELVSRMNKLKYAIKEYRFSKKEKKYEHLISFEEGTQSWLSEEIKDSGLGARYKIQCVMGKLFRKARELRQECRQNGHIHLSESVRLLELMDMMSSVTTSYNNIHSAGSDSKKVFSKKIDSRAYFREYVSKKYASEIVSSSQGANVVFIEDLEMDFDSDNDGNSLTRLFAPGMLKNKIENALHKAGIGCVFVQPALTSKIDPVTGLFGYRDKIRNKEKLFVVRNNVLGYVNSDLAAAVNIMLVGVNHSVFPRRFFVKESVPVKETGKRLKKFFKERGVKKLYLSGDKVVPFKTENSPTCWIYVMPDGFITEKQKKCREDEIKHLALSEKCSTVFALSTEVDGTYKAFRVRKVLD